MFFTSLRLVLGVAFFFAFWDTRCPNLLSVFSFFVFFFVFG